MYDYCGCPGCCGGLGVGEAVAESAAFGYPYPYAAAPSLNGSIRQMSVVSGELDRGLYAIEAGARSLRNNAVLGAPRYPYAYPYWF